MATFNPKDHDDEDILYVSILFRNKNILQVELNDIESFDDVEHRLMGITLSPTQLMLEWDPLGDSEEARYTVRIQCVSMADAERWEYVVFVDPFDEASEGESGRVIPFPAPEGNA